MVQNHCTSPRPPWEADSHPDFSLREWDLKASRVGRNTDSLKRFSTSSLKEEVCPSFRSSITAISSSPSSPGYPLKALHASTSNKNYDCSSPEGFVLNSKWSDAEKYIRNPYSGQVPVECLLASSFHNLHRRITMSAPLVYSDKTRTSQIKPTLTTARKSLFQIPIEEKEVMGMKKDVEIESIEAETIKDHPSWISSNNTSSNLTRASTPSIRERMSKPLRTEREEMSNSSRKLKSAEEFQVEGIQKEEDTKKESYSKEEDSVKVSDHNASSFRDDFHGDGNEEEQMHGGSSRRPRGVGCLSWMRSRRLYGHHYCLDKRDEATATTPRNIKKRTFFIISCTKARRKMLA
ncbi:hypothetical protein SAY87_007588 [Trapa incisa]|uniref:Uncharacterized protein n=1 Tax=Trapa incisa TaxID=236973 RepID=A0AAN7QF47_9MYRT|nr:hypothetical protein SAY87_007588 [Trapa incisa]